jgi:hypothetical protein
VTAKKLSLKTFEDHGLEGTLLPSFPYISVQLLSNCMLASTYTAREAAHEDKSTPRTLLILGAMPHTLGLAFAGVGTLAGYALINYLADKFRVLQPTRGTRLPLGQIQQNIQPEKKSAFLKSAQRPLSVPNLKSLFNSNSKVINDENKDVEKDAQSGYLPTTHIPLPSIKKGLAKRNTTIFRDPILKTVEEVDDVPAGQSDIPEHKHDSAASISITAPQPETFKDQSAPSQQCESIIAPVKDIILAQQSDATKDDNAAVTASAPQITNPGIIISINTALPALSHVSEPDAQGILEAANTAEQYLNPPAPPTNSEPSVQDAQMLVNGLNTITSPPALSATSEPVIHTISSSPDLNEFLIVKKVRGPAKRQSNPALPVNVDTRQFTSIQHAAPQHYQAARPIVSKDRIVTAFLPAAPQQAITVSEAVIADPIQDATSEDKNGENILRSTIPMAYNERKVSALHACMEVPALPAIKGPEIASASGVRISSLDDGPPLPDLNGPIGLCAAVAKSIQANALKSNEMIKAPREEKILSVKKIRDIIVRAPDYPQPVAWAPAMQPPGTHQHADNCAAVGMLGPKAVQSRYLTPHYTLPPELHGVEPGREEEAYDSYEDDDDYVTARSYRSNGETTNDGATTDLFPRWSQKARREIAEATVLVESTRTQEDLDDEAMDPTMVAEYADEIFAHLRYLEVKMLPNPFYMEEQNELQWSMRSVLMDWLVQVHSRCNLLPETLFITANFVDRFLSGKIVSLGKLQLVGATALFLASKKEEINCPTLGEIVYMVDNTYTGDELIKAERYMLNILKWELEFPGPMSFLRRISKADDYDLETRTLAKYFLEVALMEERFIGCPCSFSAAASHCMARLMLKKGHWVCSPHSLTVNLLTCSRHPITCTIRITPTPSCILSYECCSVASRTL